MDSHQVAPVVGSFRKFGPAGPVYEVTGFGRKDTDGKQWMQIHIFDSGEDVEYRLEDMVEDPEAQ